MKVKGYCPEGCGETLVMLPDNSIACEGDQCPRPFAVAEVLSTQERARRLAALLCDGRA